MRIKKSKTVVQISMTPKQYDTLCLIVDAGVLDFPESHDADFENNVSACEATPMAKIVHRFFKYWMEAREE